MSYGNAKNVTADIPGRLERTNVCDLRSHLVNESTGSNSAFCLNGIIKALELRSDTSYSGFRIALLEHVFQCHLVVACQQDREPKTKVKMRTAKFLSSPWLSPES